MKVLKKLKASADVLAAFFHPPGVDGDERFAFIEARVGDADVSGLAEDGKRLCANRLCHATGAGARSPKAFDCAAPLQGRYVTLQSYAGYNGGLVVKEVEVELYCSGQEQPLGESCPMPPAGSDSCTTLPPTG